MNDTTKKYLTFTLDRELFALDISSVREVQDMTNITRIPQATAYMRGVVNLRGNAVPVLDIKMKFGMQRTEQTINTRIIIMDHMYNGKECLMGVLADSVKEVLEIDDKDIDPTPRMGALVNADYIIGVAKKQDRFILLLDMLKVLATRDVAHAAEEFAHHQDEQAKPEGLETSETHDQTDEADEQAVLENA